MKYRNFGKSDLKMSALGFGAMRFPSEPEDNYDNPIESESIKLLHHAIDNGVNYIDTAYPYHNGKSEVIVGKALKNGYREKVKLATKLPCWLVEKVSDFDKYLNIQLERLQTDKIDYYLLHGVWKDRWKQVKDLKMLESAEKALKDGRIGQIGFSFHDNLDLFKEVIDFYDNWGMCQIQYNFLNENVQAGTKGLKYAGDKGIPVVVMEPLLGGSITNPPQHINDMWKKAHMKPSDLALRWLWDKPEVSLVLSGMRSMKDLEENLLSADNSGVGTLADGEYEFISKIANEYDKLANIPCTKCRYCLPCPQSIDIPRNFELYNESLFNKQLSKSLYSYHMNASEMARSCINCKKCEEKCPQNIKISELMPMIDQELTIIE